MTTFTPLPTAPPMDPMEPKNAELVAWVIRFRKMSLNFKIAEIIIGAICLGVLYYYIFDYCLSGSECPHIIDNIGTDLFKYMNVTALATTVLILIVSIIRHSSIAIRVEMCHQSLAAAFYFIDSGCFLLFFFLSRESAGFDGLLTIPIFGYVNSVIYMFNSRLCQQAGLLGVGVNL